MFAGGCSDFIGSGTASSGFTNEQPDRSDGKWMLAPVDGHQLTAPRGKSIRIGFELVDPNDETRADEVINFELTDNAGSDASLASELATTDDSGVATVQFRAGTTLDTVTVQANHRETAPTALNVETKPLSEGNLSVTVEDSQASPAKVGAVDIRLYPADQFDCEEFNGLADMPAPERTQRIPTVDERALFETVAPNTDMTAVALGRGRQADHLAAAGCQSNIEASPGETETAEVRLDELPLDPQGTYKITSFWDMTKVVDGTLPVVGTRISKVIDAVADPAGAIFGKVRTYIEDNVSSIVAFAVDNSETARKIKEAIDRRVQQNGITDKLNKVSEGLEQAMTNLEIRSTLTVGSRDETGEVMGNDEWRVAYVYNRDQCAADAPPECGRTEIPLQSEQPDGLSANWTGRVNHYHELTVDEHTIRLDLGHLLSQVLTKAVIPRLTDGNATTLEGAVQHWFDCAGLAQSLVSNGDVCAAGVCIDQSTVESACTTAITKTFDYEQLLADQFAIQAALEVSSTGTLDELSDQAKVQKITDGASDAAVRTIGGNATAPAKGTWTGERQ
jgi:hypothetical protein